MCKYDKYRKRSRSVKMRELKKGKEIRSLPS